MSAKVEAPKGVVLVRYKDGKERILSKYIYLKMKNSGSQVVLLKEGLHKQDLR